jgi:hypothetical protein
MSTASSWPGCCKGDEVGGSVFHLSCYFLLSVLSSVLFLFPFEWLILYVLLSTFACLCMCLYSFFIVGMFFFHFRFCFSFIEFYVFCLSDAPMCTDRLTSLVHLLGQGGC